MTRPSSLLRGAARPPRFALLVAGALACGLFMSAPALAQDGLHTPLSSAPTPPSPPGEGATAEKVLAALDAKAKVVAAPAGKAREALERARGARVSGDALHMQQLEALALEWAETARDVLRAIGAEQVAATEQTRARELETKVERARVLLGETQARLGRAAAELERAETEARDAAKAAAETEDARTAPGARKKTVERKPAKKPGAKKKEAP